MFSFMVGKDSVTENKKSPAKAGLDFLTAMHEIPTSTDFN